MNLEGNKFIGRMPDEVCKLRQGIHGSLQTLSATCIADVDKAETSLTIEEALFMTEDTDQSVLFVCNAPECCSSCEDNVP